jgi:hypothetical protein
MLFEGGVVTNLHLRITPIFPPNAEVPAKSKQWNNFSILRHITKHANRPPIHNQNQITAIADKQMYSQNYTKLKPQKGQI